MKIKKLFIIFLCLFSFNIAAQDLAFDELGSDPAGCRLYGYQANYGLVYASVTGGTPDYEYLWEHLETGFTSTNATWGGRNPGNYKITVTDALGATIEETIYLDSLNPVANFNVVSADLSEIPGGYIGFAPAEVMFENTSNNYAHIHNLLADTTFYWNFNLGTNDWILEQSLSNQYANYYYGGEFTVGLVVRIKNGCTDTTKKIIGLFGSELGIVDAEEQNFNLISQASQDRILVVNTQFNEPIQLKIYSLSGAIIIEETIVDTFTPIPFNANTGIYIYEFIDPKTGELYSGKFNY